MKTMLLCCLVLAISISGYAQQKSFKIEGAWKLVQHQIQTGNSIVTDFPGTYDVDQTKMWSANRFMFVNKTKNDTIGSYGVGTYKLAGNKYEETIKYHSYRPYEGMTIKMLMVMKNDTLIQTFPVDDKGQFDKNGVYIEKYIKIKN